jgi:hypothetical protein
VLSMAPSNWWLPNWAGLHVLNSSTIERVGSTLLTSIVTVHAIVHAERVRQTRKYFWLEHLKS